MSGAIGSAGKAKHKLRASRWRSEGVTAKAPEAARRAGRAIEQQFLLLEKAPDIGRPLTEVPELRELEIAFGNAGHVALYRHEPADDAVYVLALRHQKEPGY